MKVRYAAVLAVLGLAAGSAKAAFTLVDNFDEYAAGSDLSVAPVGSWVQTGTLGGANAGAAVIVANPSGGGNVLSLADLSGANTSVYLNSPTVTMPVGSTPATLFFMIQAKGDGLAHEGTAGMTDSAAPGGFGDGRGWTMLGNDGDAAGASPALNNVGVGDYTQDATNTMSGPWGWQNNILASNDTWYKVWQVYHVDGSGVTGGTYDTYIQGGTEFPTQTLIKSGYFRTSGLTVPPGDGAAGALTTMVMLSDDPSVSFFDNIYVDTGSANLADPTAGQVPEPATIGLLGLGVVGLMSRRRARG